MAVGKLKAGTRTALSNAAGLNSLASATYVNLGTITFGSASLISLNCKLEVEVTAPGTVSSNQQLLLFARASMDGTNFTSGPTSGTTATDEPNLIFIGALPLRTVSALQRGQFDLAAAFGGSLPLAAQIIAKNEVGAALPASGHNAFATLLDGDIT